MANINTSFSLDMLNLDLNRPFAYAYDWGLLDNYYYLGYEDAYIVDWSLGDYYFASVFGGTGITVDNFKYVTGGTATGYLETIWDGYQYVESFAIENFSLSALDLFNAASTVPTDDDYNLLSAMLSGKDLITGSSYNDVLIGLSGDDEFWASQGNDVIYGGNGVDSYQLTVLNSSEVSIVELQDGGFSITSSAFGTDIVYDVENIALSDGTFTLNSFLNTAPYFLSTSSEYSTYKNNPLSAQLSTPYDDQYDAVYFYLGSNSPSNGQVSISTDGSFTYTPNNDFSGSDSFSVYLSDGDLSSNELTITIETLPSLNPDPIETYEPLTNDPFIDATTTGYRWTLDTSKTIDFSLSGGFAGEFWFNPDTVSNYLQEALNQFAYYIDVEFNYLGHFSDPSEANAAGSEINLTLDGELDFTSSIYTWAIGFFPNPAYESTIYPGAAGDMYLNIHSDANFLPSYEPGSAGWALLLHELGHTFGLKHPHDNGGTGRLLFSDVVDLSFLDKDYASVMSYQDDMDWSSNLDLTFDPATPMITDVLALQYLYGKNDTTNTGDTVFNLSELASLYTTLWDADGTDTLDFSSCVEGFSVFMPEKQFSSLIDTKAGFTLANSQISIWDTTGSPLALTWLAGDYENVIGSDYGDFTSDNSLNNFIYSGAGNDYIEAGIGADRIECGSGLDEIELITDIVYASNVVTRNVSSTDASQIGTFERVSLSGKCNYESVIDGGLDSDSLTLSNNSDAIFVHDVLSSFHSSLTLQTDSIGNQSVSRLSGLEEIFAEDGDDVIDLTSPDYSFAGQSIMVDGGYGNDVLWGSDANELLFGGHGEDRLFGGIGTNTLTGGSGADKFQFTKTSTQDTVTDFSVEDGDVLMLFNRGGANFDLETAVLTGGNLTINYDASNTITINLTDTTLTLDEIESNILVI